MPVLTPCVGKASLLPTFDSVLSCPSLLLTVCIREPLALICPYSHLHTAFFSADLPCPSQPIPATVNTHSVFFWSSDSLAISPESVCSYDLHYFLSAIPHEHFTHVAKTNHDRFPLRSSYALLSSCKSSWNILQLAPM